jgi:hypothetical protein
MFVGGHVNRREEIGENSRSGIAVDLSDQRNHHPKYFDVCGFNSLYEERFAVGFPLFSLP